jgi:hypothetical protein
MRKKLIISIYPYDLELPRPDTAFCLTVNTSPAFQSAVQCHTLHLISTGGQDKKSQSYGSVAPYQRPQGVVGIDRRTIRLHGCPNRPITFNPPPISVSRKGWFECLREESTLASSECDFRPNLYFMFVLVPSPKTQPMRCRLAEVPRTPAHST